MLKFRKIQAKLFFSHIMLVLVFVIILGITFYAYTSSIIQNNVLKTYVTLSKTVSNQLDGIVRDMDAVSSDIISSRVFYNRDTFLYYFEQGLDYLALPDTTSNYVMDYFFDSPPQNTKNNAWYKSMQESNISNVIKTINGPNYRTKQIILFDLTGKVFYGPDRPSINEDEYMDKIQKLSWTDKVLQKNGSKVLIPTRVNEWDPDGESVFSLVRSFSDSTTHTQKAIIEVQQYYKKLEDVISPTLNNRKGKVYILDDNNELVYPLKSQLKNSDYKYIGSHINDKNVGQLSIVNPHTSEKETLIYMQSAYTGWTTIFDIADSDLYAETNSFRNWFIVIFFIVVAFTGILTYFVSRSITSPIKLLHKSIRNTDFNNLSNHSESKLISSVDEISQVYNSFREVCVRLDNTMKENIEVRSSEERAHWMALQAQMNPHFLYNTLSVIALTSEEGNSGVAGEMCRMLSSMLKYVTKVSGIESNLSQELEYTMNYLTLMKRRYEEFLVYDIDIPHNMMQIKIPKLILQPLAENCINHGFRDSRPPWKLSIKGEIIGDRWCLTVADNGCGMETTKLIELAHEIKNPNKQFTLNKDSHQKEIGLGLVNTLIRLKVMNKEAFDFSLKNNESGGFSVSFMGPYYFEGG